MNRAARKRMRLSSGLPGEVGRLLALCRLLVAHQLDQFFTLTPAGAGRRRTKLWIVLLAFLVLEILAHLLLRFPSGLAGATASGTGGLLPVGLLILLRSILVVGIAAAIGLQSAGTFLADVFELRDTRVAWRFLGGMASGSGKEVLHLAQGKVAESDKNSAIVQIGGPGRVIVDSDTAALFEKPDGTTHVVGASIDQGYSGRNVGARGFVLEGFERLREPIIDLRDQYLGNPSSEPLTVVGRSLDGLPISVTDVRGLFSLRRDVATGPGGLRSEEPFPFRAADVERLIYNQAVEVQASGEHASGMPGDWTSTMHGLICESLREFMSRNRLADFLAGVGGHETERSEFRADTLLSKTLQVSPDLHEPLAPRTAAAPSFRPRTELTATFRRNGSEFSTMAQAHGLELHWIGVGTWKVPDPSSEATIGEKNLEAWRLNRENSQRAESEALDRMTETSLLDHKLRLIQDVPLSSHETNRRRYSDQKALMESLLEDFRRQLGDALDIHYRNGTSPAEIKELEEAVLHMERLLKISQIGHVIGGGTMSRVRESSDWEVGRHGPPAPASRSEAEQYRALLGKLKGDYRVAEAMITNEQRRHGELTREQLIARIVERFERHGK